MPSLRICIFQHRSRQLVGEIEEVDSKLTIKELRQLIELAVKGIVLFSPATKMYHAKDVFVDGNKETLAVEITKQSEALTLESMGFPDQTNILLDDLHIKDAHNQLEVTRILDSMRQKLSLLTSLSLIAPTVLLTILALALAGWQPSWGSIHTSPTDVETRLHTAARLGKGKLIVQLAQGGANVEATDEAGNTPLHLGAMYGEVASIKALVASGARLDARNKAGATPVFLASQHGHFPAVEAILTFANQTFSNEDDVKKVLPSGDPPGDTSFSYLFYTFVAISVAIMSAVIKSLRRY